MKYKEPIEIICLDDPSMSLENWMDVIEGLIEQYGKSAVMYTDAGYNNVSFCLEEEEGRLKDKCPYDAHADDCDCGGAGGDR